MELVYLYLSFKKIYPNLADKKSSMVFPNFSCISFIFKNLGLFTLLSSSKYIAKESHSQSTVTRKSTAFGGVAI